MKSKKVVQTNHFLWFNQIFFLSVGIWVIPCVNYTPTFFFKKIMFCRVLSASKDSCLSNISVMYKDWKNYEKADDFLKSRFQKCKRFLAYMDYYALSQKKNYSLNVKTYSSCQYYKIVSFVKPDRQSKWK